jgi:cytochrome b561
MNLHLQSSSYTATAKLLHWFMALAIACLFAFGFYVANMPLSPQKLQFMSYHKWAGVTVFLLALIRLSWRFTHRPPVLPAHMNTLEQFAAHAGHAMLYVLMFCVPLSGWLMSSAKGFQTVLFGVLPIPDLIGKDRELGKTLLTVHLGLNLVLAAVVAGHALAALKHHFKDRDDVLTRMLPFRKS